MKKNLFIILVTTMLILALLYLYDKVEIIKNKNIENNHNIHIEYPTFNNTKIDNYIENYLNNYVKNSNKKIYIDYDYIKKNKNINLTLYIYEQKNNLIKEREKNFKINLSKEEIEVTKNIKKNNKNLEINNNKNSNKLIALTFDDGPNHNTNKILNILEKYNIKATFFILGCNIKDNENIIKRMKKLNMEIGNHMYSHKLLNNLTEKEIIEEYTKTDNLIFNIIKEYPTLIRPSYGTNNQRINKTINRPIIIWSIDPEDWKYHNSKRIYQKVTKNIKDGNIILLHDIYNATANSLELIIPNLLTNNWKFVTISELYQQKGITLEKGKVYRKA